MAHNLDFSNGRANMAFVGDRKAIWHGLGQQMPDDASIEAWAKAAGLDWRAIKTPIMFEVDGVVRQAPDQFAIVRSDTLAMLGAFTGRYKEVQPIETLEFFRHLVEADDRFSIETAGCLKGGAVIWALAKFQDSLDVVGEKHMAYALITTSFDGSLATTAQATMIRVVCNNTLTASIFDPRAATVKIRHSTAWTPEVAAGARKSLAKVAESFGSYGKMAEAMIGLELKREQAQAFLASLLSKGDDESEVSTRRKNQIDALLASYDATIAEGTERNTGWAAFNAVTRYADHDRGTRKTGGESESAARMSSAFFGSGAQLKAQAAKALLDMAAVPVPAMALAA